MERQDNRRKNVIYHISIVILAAVFVGSGGMLLHRFVSERRQEAALDRITTMVPAAKMPGADGIAGREQGKSDGTADWTPGEPADISPEQWKLWWEQEAGNRFAAYEKLKVQNPDMAGWIRIEGTRIDYPVMQTPDEPDYYLHRDFNKKKSNYGIPYMAGVCRYEEPGTNLLIYGHHMKNGAMFAALDGYTEEAYYRAHPYIQFDTTDRAGSYEIAAVVRIAASGEAAFWQDVLFPASEPVWESAWEAFEQQSFYRTGVQPEYGDRLLALVTCEYTLKDGRLMVVAREIR